MSDYVGPYSPQYYETQFGAYEEPSWRDLFSQGIDRAADVARGVWGDYRYPDDPRYRPNVSIYPQPAPQPVPQPVPAPGVTPQPGAQNKDSVTLSNTTLMLMVGGVLLFFLGTKKGR